MLFESNDTTYCPCLPGGGGGAPRWPLSGSEDKDVRSREGVPTNGEQSDATRSVKERWAKGHGVRKWRRWNEKDNAWVKERGR